MFGKLGSVVRNKGFKDLAAQAAIKVSLKAQNTHASNIEKAKTILSGGSFKKSSKWGGRAQHR